MQTLRMPPPPPPPSVAARSSRPATAPELEWPAASDVDVYSQEPTSPRNLAAREVLLELWQELCADSTDKGGSKRSCGRASKIAALLTRDRLLGLQHMSLQDASQRVGIGRTLFKKACRREGIDAWPVQAIRSPRRMEATSAQSRQAAAALPAQSPRGRAAASELMQVVHGMCREDTALPLQDELAMSTAACAEPAQSQWAAAERQHQQHQQQLLQQQSNADAAMAAAVAAAASAARLQCARRLALGNGEGAAGLPAPGPVSCAAAKPAAAGRVKLARPTPKNAAGARQCSRKELAQSISSSITRETLEVLTPGGALTLGNGRHPHTQWQTLARLVLYNALEYPMRQPGRGVSV